MYLGLFSYHRIACHSGQLDIYRVQSTLRSLFAKMALLGWACALLFPLSVLVHGHGNMVRPCAWWDANKIGWYFLENGDESMVGCGTLNLPPCPFITVHCSYKFTSKDAFDSTSINAEFHHALLVCCIFHSEQCIGRKRRGSWLPDGYSQIYRS